MSLRVNIIGKTNGVGLDRDARLLASALTAAGCEVKSTQTGSRQSGRRKSLLFKLLRWLNAQVRPKPLPRYDVNVMLEHVWTQYLNDARINVLVPNPDFFDRHDVKATPRVDCVWAKTEQAERIFRGMNSNVRHISFDSEDRMLADIPRQRTFFHLAGSSSLKGTQRLLETWIQHHEWPMLVVAGRLKFKPPVAPNILIHGGYLEDSFLKRLQNESMVHVCTSEAEGWGHYLVEAMSVGAAVITVDAPPMNALVAPDRGWLLPCFANGQQRLIPRFAFDQPSLIAVVEQVNALPDDTIMKLGQTGRLWYENNRAAFPVRVKQVLDEACVMFASRLNRA